MNYELAKLIYRRAKTVVDSDLSWEFKFYKIFSKDISGRFDFYRSDTSLDYKEDIMAFMKAFDKYLKTVKTNK